MRERFEGSKYEAGLSNVEIAKRLRGEIKAAKAAGELPKGLKVSVRYRGYAGGSSIDVTVKELGFPLINEEWVALEMTDPHRPYHPHDVRRYTPEAEAVKAKLEAMHRAYNHDGSDIMTDYFDVKFYGSVSFDYTLERADREAVEELLKLRAVVAKRAEEAAELMVAEAAAEPAPAAPSVMEEFLEWIEGSAAKADRTKAPWNF